MKPLVIIPARGGSKGIPGKNIKLLNGKPLIYYTIDAARELFDDDVICVSTDDEEIKTVVEQTGLKVPFLRPIELATDTAGSYEVLLHVVDFYESIGIFSDILILLQPTSPFRKGSQILEALKVYNKYENIDMVVSVKESKLNPYYNLFEESTEGTLIKSKESNYIRRQDCPKVWEYNGAIYIINVKALKSGPIHKFNKVLKYEMDEISSIDIDTMFDWQIAELMIANHMLDTL